MEDVVQLFDKVDQNREAMVDTWKLLVDRDCGSGNKAGVAGVGRDVKDFLEKCGFKVIARPHDFMEIRSPRPKDR